MVNGESILQGPAAAVLIGRMTRERQTQANGDRIMAMNEMLGRVDASRSFFKADGLPFG